MLIGAKTHRIRRPLWIDERKWILEHFIASAGRLSRNLREVTHRAFLIALLLIAANLRPALTGVGPLLETIQNDLRLSATAAGLLGSLPILIFAAFAPLARLARQYGAERILLAGLLALIAGTLVRSQGHAAALFGGTLLLATGIAGINVLIPVLVKQHYPERVPAITTAYATVMGGFAALASGVAVPLAHSLPGGWRSSLASWALLAVIALIVWLPQVRAERNKTQAPKDAAPHPPWRTPLAWQITGYMGLQSTLFYIAVSWFPTILRENGFSPVAAGWMLTLFQVAALVAGLAIPRLIRQFKNQQGLAFGVAALSTVATLGLLIAPSAAAVWMILLGCGAGPSLILALSFMGLRASSQQTAAALSLMAQGIGYLIAAAGPILFGLVHDHTGGWTLALLGTAAVTVLQALCGIGAGRTVKV
jgi:MFS transporter, CP family, cyanate transporter